MHFESLDSSAVDELHKLTDYNSGHQLENQFYFHFLGKILDVFASCSQCNAINYFDCSALLSLSPYHCQSCCSGRGANVGLRPYGFLTFLHLDCLQITFTFMQFERFLASGHKQGDVTKLGKFTPPSTGPRCLKPNFLHENQSSSLPLHLPPLWAPPAGYPLSF